MRRNESLDERGDYLRASGVSQEAQLLEMFVNQSLRLVQVWGRYENGALDWRFELYQAVAGHSVSWSLSTRPAIRISSRALSRSTSLALSSGSSSTCA